MNIKFKGINKINKLRNKKISFPTISCLPLKYFYTSFNLFSKAQKYPHADVTVINPLASIGAIIRDYRSQCLTVCLSVCLLCRAKSCLRFLGFFLISGWLIGSIVRLLDSQTTPSSGLWATFSWLAEHFRALINCKWLTLAHKNQKRKHFVETEGERERSQSNWFLWRKENAIEKLIEKLLLRVPFPMPDIGNRLQIGRFWSPNLCILSTLNLFFVGPILFF